VVIEFDEPTWHTLHAVAEVDRNRLWRSVRENWAAFDANAPEGYEAVVEVYLSGAAAPVLLKVVQTTRDPSFVWELLLSSEVSSPESHPSDRLTFVPEHLIGRVEVGYRRKGDTPFGFAHVVIDDPPDDDG